MRKLLVFAILLVLILSTSSHTICDENTDSNDVKHELSDGLISKKNSQNHKIEKGLLLLINKTDTNPNFRSLNHNAFDFVDDKIRVEVSLENENSLPFLNNFSNDLVVENHYKLLAQILVPIELLINLSEESYVKYIRKPIKPRLLDVTSEGVGVIGADEVQAEGYSGSGVKVAIIDVGFQGYTTNPDLPADRIIEAMSFRADGDIEAGEKHGCACAEIVLDVAPQADLYLYNFETISELNNAVTHAISAGIDVISFSIGYTYINNFDGVGYPEIGDVCGIVDNAKSNGILFVVSSGNEADHHYEGTFTDNNGNDYHEFGIGDEELDLGFLTAGTEYYFELTWDDWPYSDQDYELILFDSTFNLIDMSLNDQTGSQPPEDWIMGFIPYGDEYYLDILKWDAVQSVDFELYGCDEIPFPEYNHPESSLICPADALGAMAVGATLWSDDTLEYYSSRGPTNDGRTKPDVVAPTGVATFIYPDPFYGTSASAPHVAGASALLLSVGLDCGPDKLQNILETTSLDLGATGKDNLYGTGRINVWDAYNYIKPTADFSYNPLNPTTDNSIQFNDASSDNDGSIILWYWDFGDGNTSTSQNPTHQYGDNGTYTITLNVTDDVGATNKTSKQITVTNVGPTADYTFSPPNPATIDTIQFTDSSIDSDGQIVAWYWDFGDGNTSTTQNPTHQYGDDVIYNVSLNVTDDDGATNKTTKQITITNVPPTANFTYAPLHPTDIQTISFTDTSTDNDGTVISWNWNFGDGNTSTQQNPTHQYGDDGTYAVTLNVTDDDGATNKTTKQMVVSNVPPIPDFTFTPSQPNVNQTVTFTDHSTDQDGTIVSWFWDFGDGNTSTQQNPTHPYTSNGTYTVSLHVTDNDGDTNTSLTQLTVYWGPNANFTWQPPYPLVNQTIQFNDTSVDYDGAIVNWSWDFSDGNISYEQNATHRYNVGNTYTVTLNVTDDSGFHGVVSKSIIVNVPPEANFTYSLLAPKTEDTIIFNDTSLDMYGQINNWTWNFGDGNISYEQNATHQYADNGTYTVNLTVTDNCSAQDSIEKQVVILNTPPHVNFLYDPSNPTDMQIINFSDLSTDIDGAIVNWTWTFSDGNISFEQNATHQFGDNGTYTATLTITDDDGDTNTTSRQIIVLNVPPSGNFTYSPITPECFENVTFNATATDPDGNVVNWTWDFEDGNVSYTQNTTNSYSSFRSYNVTLTIKDNDDDITTITKALVMKNHTTNTTNAGISTTINLSETFDIIVTLNTTQSTTVNISQYSGNPTGENISLNITVLGKYLEITVENETTIIWPINISIFYTQDDLNNSNLNETQLLGIYFWNGTAENWELYNQTGVNISYNQSGYQGYLWAKAWHLTNITPGGDSEPPSKVTGLTVTDAKNGKLDFSWDSASDNVGVAYYRIYCDKKSVINTTDNVTYYQYTGLTNDVTYTFNISAVDTSGNEGEKSESESGTPTKKSSGGNGPGGGLPPGPTNLQPNADAGGSYTGYAGIPVVFDGSASNDSDGNISKFEWNFGDDSTETGMTPNHIYSNIGNYTVTLAVTDDNGATAEDETYVVINNLPPETPAIHGSKTGKKNITYTYTINSSDPNNDTIQYVINWGDSTNITVTEFTDNNAPVNTTHTWSAFGIYTVNAYAKDENKGTSENTSLTVLIDIMFCNESGYLIDTDSDGIYDFFYSNETGKQTLTVLEKQNYLLDRDGDGKWDYKYNETMGVKPYQEKEENGTPGFGLIPILLSATLVLFWKRKRR